LKARNHLKNLRVKQEITLKYILNKFGVALWNVSPSSENVSLAGPCEQANETHYTPRVTQKFPGS